MAVTLEQLNAFVETVKTGSFKQASYRLGKHTSTVSGLVAALESEVGIELFVRKPRSLLLTTKGDELFQAAQAVVRESEFFDLKVDSLYQNAPSSMTIAFDSMLSSPQLSDIFAAIIDKYPSVSLKLLSGDPLQIRSWVLSHQADIALTVNTFHRHQELKAVEGFRYDVVAVASPRLGLKEQKISLDELRGKTQVSAYFMKQLGQENTHDYSNRVIYSNSFHETLSLLKSAPVWAWMPLFMLQESIDSQQVDRFYVSEEKHQRANTWSSELVWHNNKPKDAVMEYFINQVNELNYS